jgi:hypothetical protein
MQKRRMKSPLEKLRRKKKLLALAIEVQEGRLSWKNIQVPDVSCQK